MNLDELGQLQIAQMKQAEEEQTRAKLAALGEAAQTTLQATLDEQRQMLEDIAARAQALGTPLSVEDLERSLMHMGNAPAQANGYLDQLLAAQRAGSRLGLPPAGNRQQRRASMAFQRQKRRR